MSGDAVLLYVSARRQACCPVIQVGWSQGLSAVLAPPDITDSGPLSDVSQDQEMPGRSSVQFTSAILKDPNGMSSGDCK